MSAALDIVAKQLTEALASERQARERVLECAATVALAALHPARDDYAMQDLRSAVTWHREAKERREQAERAVRELTEEGPYR